MANIRPVYTDGLLLWKGRLWNPGNSTVSYTWMEHTKYIDLDLTKKYGAHIFIQIGRHSISLNPETDLGAFIELRRISKGIDHPAGFQYQTDVLPVSKQTVSSAVAGSNVVVVGNSANFPVGSFIYFESPTEDPYNPVYANFEVSRIIYNDGAGNLIVDAPLKFAHTGDIAFNKAEVISPIEVRGGSIYRLAMSYGDFQLASSIIAISVYAQTYDYDLSEQV